MGLFSRRKSGQPSNSTPERDIPVLNPAWFEEQLRNAGKPVTKHNAAAAARLTSANLALNAHRWLGLIGTPLDRRQWDQRFHRPDADIEAALARPDAMIDFLWAVSPRVHPGLRDFVNSMRETFHSAAQKFGDELPADMWSTQR
jgi:hypothetical protein